MTNLNISKNDSIYYEYYKPEDHNSGHTFVFINALTGDLGMWEASICPNLRKLGHGTLVYNLRGQDRSAFSKDIKFTEDLIVEDLMKLLKEVNPPRVILVGLSIGGLFGMKAYLKGANVKGIVLLNTLRKDGTRLQWIGEAFTRAAEFGGLNFVRDLLMPLLVNEDWLTQNRKNFLLPKPDYTPLDKKSGPYKLLSEATVTADWDVPYEKLKLPVFVITGLQDHIFLERDTLNELYDRLPVARRIDIKEAGHLIPAEKPEQLTELLADFAQENM